MKKTITYERLHEVLNYDATTGVFTQKIRTSYRVKIGGIAGHLNIIGYNQIKIDGKLYKAHRLAWLYVYGYMPENDIDHINQRKNDNRIINLREASRTCNIQNSKNRADNTSGIKGVSWHKQTKKWRVRIMINKKTVYLGSFADKIQAAKARLKAEIKSGWNNCDTKKSSALTFIEEAL